MNVKRYYRVLTLGVIMMVGIVGVCFLVCSPHSSFSSIPTSILPSLEQQRSLEATTTSFSLPSFLNSEVISFTVNPAFIRSALAKYPPLSPLTSKVSRIKGVIVPHHDLASDLIAEVLQKVAQSEKPERIILLGPNHPDRGSASVLTTKAVWQMGELQVVPDEETIQELLNRRVVVSDTAVLSHEHSIFTILPFIHTYFPDAKIVPLILKSDLGRRDAFNLAKHLQDFLDDKTLLIASIDFSHYLPSNVAPQKDRYTQQLIFTHAYEKIIELTSEYSDSPASLITLLKTMELTHATSTTLVRNTNSGQILKRPLYSSTSYFTIMFGQKY